MYLRLFALCSLIISLHGADWPPVPGTAPAQLRSPGSSLGDAVVPHVIQRIPLGDVSVQARGGLQADGVVRFSPDGRLLGIGTLPGRMMVVDVYGNKILWERQVAEGMVKKIAFSPDGRTVYYGEQSVDGFVYAAESQTGKVQWRYRLADDLESSAPPAKDELFGVFTLPGVYQLQTLDDGDVLVLGIHAWGDFSQFRTMRRLSRIYRLSPEGKLRWAWPAGQPAPQSLVHMHADNGGRRVIVLAGTPSATAESLAAPNGSLVILDGSTGEVVGRQAFEPLRPHFDTVSFWQSGHVGPDGERAAVGLHDGRSFLLSLPKAKIEHTFTFGTPIMISGVPVSARSTYCMIAPDGVAYFQTAASSVPNANSMEHMVQPPGPHPMANTLNAVGKDGRVAWRFRSGHTYQNFWTSSDGRWLLTCAQRENAEVGVEAGAMLFDTRREGGGSAKLVYLYRVEGMVFFHADLAADGSALAIVETPYVDPATKRLIGTYQVHIVR